MQHDIHSVEPPYTSLCLCSPASGWILPDQSQHHMWHFNYLGSPVCLRLAAFRDEIGPIDQALHRFKVAYAPGQCKFMFPSPQPDSEEASQLGRKIFGWNYFSLFILVLEARYQYVFQITVSDLVLMQNICARKRMERPSRYGVF